MKLPLIFAIALLAFSCASDKEPEPNLNPEWEDPLEGIPDKGPIRFDSPEIGQRSRYVFFNAIREMPSEEVMLTYVPDTLVLAIIGKESEKWVIREFIDPDSKNLEYSTDEVLSYFKTDSDSVYFTRPEPYVFSWIFLHDALTIPLKPVGDPAQSTIECLPLFGYRSDVWVEYTTDYTQLGQDYSHLNNYFDYRDMSGDGVGLMHAYGPQYGIVRWTWVSPWNQNKTEGWDLLPH